MILFGLTKSLAVLSGGCCTGKEGKERQDIVLADNNVEGKVDDSAQGRVRSALLAVGSTTFLGLVFFLESQWTLSHVLHPQPQECQSILVVGLI